MRERVFGEQSCNLLHVLATLLHVDRDVIVSDRRELVPLRYLRLRAAHSQAFEKGRPGFFSRFIK